MKKDRAIILLIIIACLVGSWSAAQVFDNQAIDSPVIDNPVINAQVFDNQGNDPFGDNQPRVRDWRRRRNLDWYERVVPDWPVNKEMPEDVFTFVRIRYESWGGYWRNWHTDHDESDLNFSFRLQQLTSMEVHPKGKVIELTDETLTDYPFIYICEPGHLQFTGQEVEALRKYLLNGGFLMVDDFWGDQEWENFRDEIKRVFPKRDPVELKIDHPIFHCVFDLKEKPQIPSIGHALAGRPYNITWERGEEGREVHFKALYDDKGRMMVIICHNTDLGDGWEQEGASKWYFHEFSEKKAYPMGINIVFYAMTH